jgi:O-antigen/teichoic acid export membrane protein
VRGLGRGTAWLGGAQALRLAFQSATFVLVARALGASGFGAFAAALALTSVLAPFGACGAGNLLVMHVARERDSFSRHFGAALLTIPVAGLPLAALAVGAGALILPVPVALVVLVALAELIFARLAELSAQAFQGLERPRPFALLQLVPAVFRLAAALAFAVAGLQAPVAWGVAYLAGSATAAALCLVVVTRIAGRPRGHEGLRTMLREGSWFALAQSSANVYTDIDKTLLARLGSLPAAGVYAVAYRATAMAFTPVAGLLAASYARFFRRGAAGIRGSRRLAVELLPAACLYGAAAGAVLFLAAPVLPYVLGSDYAEATSALRWLALLPLVQGVYYLAGDALTGAGHQRVRTGIQLGAAALNALLCLWLVPAYSWHGAAWATLISLGLLALALWVAVAVVSTRRERHGDASPRLAGVQA